MDANIIKASSIRRELLRGWRLDGKIKQVFIALADEAGIEADIFARVIRSPKGSIEISPYAAKVPTRAWLASRFRHVSDALFEGADDETALKMLAKSRQAPSRPKPLDRRNEMRAMGKDIKQTVFIAARSLDRRHDWNTVK